MGRYCVIASDNSGNWYAYQQDEDGNTFDTRRDACRWAEKNLGGWTWHVAENA